MRSWGENYAHRLIDRTDPVQPWWQPDGDHPLAIRGYRGHVWSATRSTAVPAARILSFEVNFINAILTRAA
jgi:hypothetical protein